MPHHSLGIDLEGYLFGTAVVSDTRNHYRGSPFIDIVGVRTLYNSIVIFPLQSSNKVFFCQSDLTTCVGLVLDLDCGLGNVLPGNTD